MPWMMVEVAEDNPDCLTDEELVAVGILLDGHCGDPRTPINVFWRAWRKLYPAFARARERGDR